VAFGADGPAQEAVGAGIAIGLGVSAEQPEVVSKAKAGAKPLAGEQAAHRT
jgi:hypothetical protein